jgi:hypothetical protein
MPDLKRFPVNPVTILPQNVVVGEALVQIGFLFAFGHRFPLLPSKNPRQMYLIIFLPFILSRPLSFYSRLRESEIDGGTSSSDRGARSERNTKARRDYFFAPTPISRAPQSVISLQERILPRKSSITLLNCSGLCSGAK